MEEIDRIRVGANNIPVYLDPQLRDEGLFAKYEENPDFPTGFRIRLVRPPKDLIGAQAYIHEILHALDESYGLELGEPGVRTYEQLLCCLFRDNPKTLNNLLKRCADS